MQTDRQHCKLSQSDEDLNSTGCIQLKVLVILAVAQEVEQVVHF